ncbi:hypothetical protein MPC_054 [Candidatus Moranella endobia PCVAL]|uniref:DUF721 domain-containing protein n=1 Tax=Moranella endobia (strain PCIT) TaxID=903503 RepID=F7XXP4_MOREP|nr:DciA family protein [Candidatus Moranella endobia]AEI74870.1 conserved hypothetical protein MEPCIT_223 [Candidatus Moranella endobia PCIT]AGJ61116.1 hypothetical protein MPC_054 [Candidatus Moranella endobia PCVAL]
MRSSRPFPIYRLFLETTETSRVSSLLQIQQRAIMLLKLNRTVNALLPVPLRPWCRVANIRQGVMVLETASASWQIRLRYEQYQLLSVLRAQILPSLSSIDIRINPGLAITPELNAQKLVEKPRYLSANSAISIRHVAARSEGKLKNTLELLAKLAG